MTCSCGFVISFFTREQKSLLSCWKQCLVFVIDVYCFTEQYQISDEVSVDVPCPANDNANFG